MNKSHLVTAVWKLHTLRLKIRVSHRGSETTNKCLDVREQVDVKERKKDSSLPYTGILRFASVFERIVS